MKQIVDLQADSQFKAMNVALVSVATDSRPELASAAREYNITTPLLSDADKQMSQAYGILQWAMPSGEPGHTFVLVDRNGKIAWIRDYGAPQNGGAMYVPVNELTGEIKQRLGAS